MSAQVQTLFRCDCCKTEAHIDGNLNKLPLKWIGFDCGTNDNYWTVHICADCLMTIENRLKTRL